MRVQRFRSDAELATECNWDHPVKSWDCLLCGVRAHAAYCAVCEASSCDLWRCLGAGATCGHCKDIALRPYNYAALVDAAKTHAIDFDRARLANLVFDGDITVFVNRHAIVALAPCVAVADFARDVALSGSRFGLVSNRGWLRVVAHARRDPDAVQAEWVRRALAVGP